jgi:hypothetical protein
VVIERVISRVNGWLLSQVDEQACAAVHLPGKRCLKHRSLIWGEDVSMDKLDIKYVLTAGKDNTLGCGLTYMVKYMNEPIGLVQKLNDLWYASPVISPTFRLLSAIGNGPCRTGIKTRREATVWLIGIRDAQSDWFANAMEDVK